MVEIEEINNNINIRAEEDLEDAFNKFIKKWCGSWYPHLIDSDENDGQFMRHKIRNTVNKDFLKKEFDKLCDNLNSGKALKEFEKALELEE